MSSSPRSSPSPSYFEAIPVRITLNSLADLVGHPEGWVAVAFEGHFYRQGEFVPISIRGAKFTAEMATEQLSAREFVAECMTDGFGDSANWPRAAREFAST